MKVDIGWLGEDGCLGLRFLCHWGIDYNAGCGPRQSGTAAFQTEGNQESSEQEQKDRAKGEARECCIHLVDIAAGTANQMNKRHRNIPIRSIGLN